MEKRPVVPIVSGSTKYLGLTAPEWAINAVIFGGYLIVFGNNLLLPVLVHALVMLFYALFLSQLEENVLFVLISSRKIPSIFYGKFRKPIPFEKTKEQLTPLWGKAPDEDPDNLHRSAQ